MAKRSASMSAKRPVKRPAKVRKSTKPTRSPRPKAAKAAPRITLPVFTVDAFTSRPFHGNPAAVVLLESKWLADDVLQAIAAEHNLSETAFVLAGKGKKLGLRWFTPTQEVDLCGHATLAAAHVLWNHVGLGVKAITFTMRSGDLAVTRDDDLIVLDFPAWPCKRVKVTPELCAALGREPAEVWQSRDTVAVFDNKRDVHELQPDMAKLAALDTYAVIATAPGAGHDFVSRFFAPARGVPEDPVTGSAHCTLVPYWADRLKKNHLTAHQVSHRSGELFCERKGNRVMIGGHAVTYAEGKISV